MTQDTKHFSLVSGEITFQVGDDISKVTLSTVFVGDNHTMPMSALAVCQQRLQEQLFQLDSESTKSGIVLPPIQVLNVVLLSNTSLGYMTLEEFNAPPEGMVMAERQPTTEAELKNMLFGATE